MDPEDAAIAATISLLLEVSGNPKAGNVDRLHNFEDLKYEHFLASAASAFPSFLKAANGEKIGKCIFEATLNSTKWQKGGNVHFGCFLLLVPLLSGCSGENMHKIAEIAKNNLMKSDFEDSLYVLRAYQISKARVMDTDALSLKQEETAEKIKKMNLNLYNWMLMAPRENLIAKELVEGFKISIQGAETLLKFSDPNEGIVYLYHKMLSELLDPLVIAKFGIEKAEEVRRLAKKALEKNNFDELDKYLVNNRINPGTIADLTASSIFLAIAEGWRF